MGKTNKIPPPNLVKFAFDLKEDEFLNAVERVWAEPLGSDQYQLRNIPFFVRGFSHQDVVTAIPQDGELRVVGVARRGGHSTYRIFLEKPVMQKDPDFSSMWTPLGDLGCTYEGATASIFAVDVPPEVPRRTNHLSFDLVPMTYASKHQ